MIASLFYVGASATHDVVIYGREHASGYHPTIVLSNHKRDLDSLVLAAAAYFVRGVGRPSQQLVFTLREDAFWPDFLEGYLHWRGPFRLSVRAPLRLIKAYPMGYVTRRSDLPRIEAQLQTFGDLLDRGRDLYWTPEGGLSLDGRLGRFRAGFYRVVQASQAQLRMLPAAIFYDFMTTLRTRCFIRFGPELPIDRSLGKAALEQQARTAILRQMTINAGHLAAAVIRDLAADDVLSRRELERRLVQHARRLHRAGLPLDGRLTMGWTFRRRVGQLLGYLRRQGILVQDGDLRRLGAGMAHPEMQYVGNELLEVETALRILR